MRALSVALIVLLLSVGRVGAQLPSTAVSAGLGVNIHISPNAVQDINTIQASGAKFVREDVAWDNVETTQNVYNFAWHDVLSNACAADGIRILWVLDYSNPLYGNDYTSAAWQTAFTNFAKATATHFAGKGDIWEVWNEPNNFGPLDAGTYMTLANQVVPAIRGADTSATIVGPAIASNNYSFLSTCFSGGLLNLVDAVSVHPYRAEGPEDVGTNYTDLVNLMKLYHKTLPIVSSEWGYSRASGLFTTATATNPAQLQGDYMARMFLVNLSQKIPLSIWYDWRNDGTNPADYESNFGMVSQDFSVKYPAYQEMQLLTHSLKGETFTGKLNDHNSNDWLLVFTGGGHTTLAAWTTGSSRTVNVSGWGTLHLTSTPFYVDPTLLPGDANLDGTVNVQDLAILAANYRKQVTGGWLQGDFNNDGVVDVQDLALLAANYRQSYASDVVPAYNGLDAEALDLLSLAGVNAVPEPEALVLLGTGLLGLLCYVWKRRR